MGGKSNRRALVTNEPGQTRLILALVGPLNVCLSLVLLLVTVFCFRLEDEAAEAGVELSNLQPLYLGVALLVILVAAVIFLRSVKISHRIAGPVVNVEKTLEAVRSGRTETRVTLRQRDYLQPLAGALNDFLDWAEPALAAATPTRTDAQQAGPDALAEAASPLATTAADASQVDATSAAEPEVDASPAATVSPAPVSAGSDASRTTR